MKHFSCTATAALVGLSLFLSACKDDRVEGIIATQADQQKTLEAFTAQMDSRLQALEKRPRLDFTLLNVKTTINEKMFSPMVESSAHLSVSGDNMPPTFYVDVMLKVEIPDIQYESVERQIFPVVEGKSKVEMQQSLPQHGLKPEQIHVTLKPMTWYRGQIINDDMVNYR